LTRLDTLIVDGILTDEGGLTRDPRDPGGTTNWGISLRAYPHLGEDTIVRLTRAEATGIYHRDYLARIPDGLPDGLRWMAADAAVNHGVTRALTWLHDHPDLTSFTSARIEFYASLSTWDAFGRGWMRRVSKVLARIAAWEAGEGVTGSSPLVVLEGIKPADRWAAITPGAVALRGNFRYRVRRNRLDVRREG
jgi:lysozyme family protein